MANLAQLSKSEVADRLKRASSRLRNMKEQAATTMRRAAIGLGAVGGGYGAGYADGWAEANGKDLIVGDNGPHATTLAATGAILGGIFGTSFIGETGADVLLGLGAGAAGYRAGVAGRAAAMKG